MADSPDGQNQSVAPTTLTPSQWWEIKIVGVPLLDDLVFWRLQEEGCQGTSSQIINQALTVCGYLSLDRVQPPELGQMADRLRQDVQAVGQPAPEVSWQIITEEDWAYNWRDYWHPLEIGKRLLIYPAWLDVPNQSDRLLIRLNPGVAFGTGAHATTQLCLRALEQQMQEPQSHPLTIADIGCGTGILSIAALLLGADKAYAVDLDPLAIGATQASRALNGLTSNQLWVTEGSIDQLRQHIQNPVQGFCCNILASVILDLIPQFSDIAKPGSWGILSGILDTQKPMIFEALHSHHWEVRKTDQDQDWCCLIISR
ncbi:50S ribosomal protein L11 methyltransferase [Acaryochloris sp. IP29b_bin.137]|uniref:50S ribosomal protein L11 methyltransferase n=1 Tax=Acaryochloris sp. IP29b_bin.137 TaxID=2969217 RepID=UPI00263373ED|nr:50S ribosomal protein L11 methyltransferase [Acaryochloris sp. IP29b_bin.137]